jgi:hypothetical protein
LVLAVVFKQALAPDVKFLLVLFANKKLTRLGKVRGRAMAEEAARLETGSFWRGLCGCLQRA